MPTPMKNGKWRAHKMIDGKRKTKVCKTKAEARKWEARQTRELWENEKTATDSLTMLDLANDYLDYSRQKHSAKTFREEKKAVFVRLFAMIPPALAVSELGAVDCLKFLSTQARERSGNCANKDRKNLIAAWNWGIKYLALPSDNPFKAVEPFPVESKPRYVPPETDFWKVHAVAQEEDKVFLLTLLHTAARRGELLRMQWDHLDFARKTISLGTRKRKGGSMEYDQVPMTQELGETLLRHKRNARSVFVFCGADGQPYKHRLHLMKNLCRRAAVRHFGFHAIRHLSASMLAQAGVDIPTIQAILRHKNPLTTSLYIRKLGIVDNALEKVFGRKGTVIEMEPRKASGFGA